MLEEARNRAGIITRWLETDEEYHVPEGADFLLGPSEDGVMRGLSLPPETLEKLYCPNFERLAGSKPKKIDLELAAQECERIAEEISILRGVDAKTTLQPLPQ